MKRLTEEEQREWARCLRERADEIGSEALRVLAANIERDLDDGVLWPHPEQP